MNPILNAIIWLFFYAATLGGLFFALSRYNKRIAAATARLRRRAPGSGVSLLADLHVRRALWFSMLDMMHERYAILLESARAGHRGQSTRN
jgi:hypothetical protein